ncbi:hypothetical protein GCM10009639_19860 [Kitasatospora putterlickiae]|uniref:Uncharacterized protein n=1 Tax=Kitasatospora putterlickiae TaxID=221725 RepID=A0ABN1XUU1_9ACTN
MPTSQIRRISGTSSASRAAGRSSSMPCQSEITCGFPVPRPSWTRPGASSASERNSVAVATGVRPSAQAMAEPIRIREVAAATAASVTTAERS